VKLSTSRLDTAPDKSVYHKRGAEILVAQWTQWLGQMSWGFIHGRLWAVVALGGAPDCCEGCMLTGPRGRGKGWGPGGARSRTAREMRIETMRRVKPSLCLISSAPRDRDVWRCGGISPPFITSALDGDEWPASCPGRFIPGERPPACTLDRGPGRPRAGPDAVEKGKFFCFSREELTASIFRVGE
jgi:hypothetical protein